MHAVASDNASWGLDDASTADRSAASWPCRRAFWRLALESSSADAPRSRTSRTEERRRHDGDAVAPAVGVGTRGHDHRVKQIGPHLRA